MAGRRRTQPAPKGYRWVSDVLEEPWWTYSRPYMLALCKNGYFDKFVKTGKNAVVRVGLLKANARNDTRPMALAVEAVNGLKRECCEFV